MSGKLQVGRLDAYVVTCLSLVGLVRFASQAQQRKLFSVLVVELVVVAVGFFAGLIRFDAGQVQTQVIRDYMSSPGARALASDFRQSDFSMSNFSGGRFDGSLFDTTSFKNARFSGADLRGADLSSALIDETTTLPQPTANSSLQGTRDKAARP